MIQKVTSLFPTEIYAFQGVWKISVKYSTVPDFGGIRILELNISCQERNPFMQRNYCRSDSIIEAFGVDKKSIVLADTDQGSCVGFPSGIPSGLWNK
jgi:hypothetical protein